MQRMNGKLFKVFLAPERDIFYMYNILCEHTKWIVLTWILGAKSSTIIFPVSPDELMLM